LISELNMINKTAMVCNNPNYLQLKQ